MKKTITLVFSVSALLCAFAINTVQAQIITTIAGSSPYGMYGGDGGPATAALLNGPAGVTLDKYGNIYIADQSNQRVRKIDTAGNITTFAGAGTYGSYVNDGGPASTGVFDDPTAIAIDKIGNVYITDLLNGRVRIVNTADTINTFAGDGSHYYSGDGGPATNAMIIYPIGVTADTNRNIYITDGGSNVIRKVDATGIITTIAGTNSGTTGPGLAGYTGDGGPATDAKLNYPECIVIDKYGNLFFADYNNNAIREINTAGIITTVAGGNLTPGFSGDGGPATAAELNSPGGVAVDTNGNIYIADAFNQRIRKVNTSGIITTIAGNGTLGFSGDGGNALLAELRNPYDLAVDNSGNVYFSDANNNRIRRISSYIPAITGLSNLCIGATITLTDSMSADSLAGFTWSSSNTAIATVDSTGVVTGISTGTDTISYTIGAVSIIHIIRVGIPDAGIISGSATVCTGYSISLAETVAGGAWSAANGNAIVDGSVAIGITAGTDTIYYTVSNACGSNSASYPITIPGTTPVSNITTIAGNNISGYTGDGSVATTAAMNEPRGIAIDGNGNYYIADGSNNVIRKIDTAGIITTIAGNGYGAGSGFGGYTGDGGPATDAELYSPWSIAVDDSGNVYIADNGNEVIRKVDHASGMISTIAGTGTTGYTGDGAAATAAQLSDPIGVSLDAAGNVYIADAVNNVIRKINTAGIITTIAGNGAAGYTGDGAAATAAELNTPYAVSVDKTGNIFIADNGNYSIRKINTSGIISTIAGNGTAASTWNYGDGGPAYMAELVFPTDVKVDAFGNIFIADSYFGSVRKINTAGIINTVAGNGTSGFSGDGGPATAAELNGDFSVATDNSGNLFIADANNNVIRKVVFSTALGDISGPALMCITSADTLTATGADGTWSASNSIASIDGTGVLTLTAPGSDTIIYTMVNRCGMASLTSIVTVDPIAYAGTISGPASVCLSATGTFTDSTAVAGGAWTLVNTNAGISGSLVTGMTTGTDTIKYVITNSCGADSTWAPITISPLPVVSVISGAASMCVATSLTFADSVTGGTWSSINANAVMAGNVATGISAGMDSIQYSVTNSCGTAVAAAGITVLPLPDPGSLIGSDSVCPGATITITATSTGGTWSMVNINATDSMNIITGVTAGMDTVKYVVSNSCGSDSAWLAIVIDPLPDAGTISGNHTICPGASDTLTATVPGGTWSAADTNARVSITGIVTGVVHGRDSIKYTLINECGTAQAAFAITIDPLPHPGRITGLSGIITGEDSICVGASLTLIDSVTTGTWNMVGVSATIVADTILTHLTAIDVLGMSPGLSEVYYVVTNSCGTDSAGKRIFVKPLPAVSAISGPGSVCAGAAITLTDTAADGTWSNTNSNAGISGTGVVTGNMAGTDTFLYKVTNSCGADSAWYAVMINAGPGKPKFIGGLPIACIGRQPDTLYVDSAGGIWRETNANASLSGNLVTGVTVGIDTIIYSIFNSCDTASDSIIITIPTAHICDSLNEVPTIGNSGSGIIIYPNPTTGIFTIAVQGIANDISISLIDMYGKIILAEAHIRNQGKITVQPERLAAGIYLVMANIDGTIYSSKVFVTGER